MFLDKQWYFKHLKNIRINARNRYTPELNVELPICEIFDSISRTKNFYISLRTHCGNLEREFSRISKQYSNNDIQKSYKVFSNNVAALLEILSKQKDYNTNLINWNSIKHHTKRANEEIWKL